MAIAYYRYAAREQKKVRHVPDSAHAIARCPNFQCDVETKHDRHHPS